MKIEEVIETLVVYLKDGCTPCEIFNEMSYLIDTTYLLNHECDGDCAKCIMKHLERE